MFIAVNLPDIPIKEPLALFLQQRQSLHLSVLGPTTKNVAAGRSHNAGYSRIIRKNFLLQPVDRAMLMNDRMIFGAIVRRNNTGMSIYIVRSPFNPTKTPMNVALDIIDKATAKKCVMNDQVRIPPSLPSSVSMGQGPVCSSFVIPIAPVITEIE